MNVELETPKSGAQVDHDVVVEGIAMGVSEPVFLRTIVLPLGMARFHPQDDAVHLTHDTRWRLMSHVGPARADPGIQEYRILVAACDESSNAFLDQYLSNATELNWPGLEHLPSGVSVVATVDVLRRASAGPSDGASIKPVQVAPVEMTETTIGGDGLAAPWRKGRPRLVSDRPEGTDQLNLSRDVETLCSVMAAKDVEPPLSIGLFGNWGSGKTFFMKQMEAWINRMMAQARVEAASSSAYCANIVQLWFNAWHYIDVDLWASLTSEIFEGLDRALRADPGLTKDSGGSLEAREHLYTAISAARSDQGDAMREKIKAQGEADSLARRLESLHSDEAKISLSLATTTIDVLRAQPGVQEQLAKVGRDLGVPAVKAESFELQSEIREIGESLGTLRAALLIIRQRPVATAVLVAGVAAVAVIAKYPPGVLNEIAAGIRAGIVSVVSVMLPLVVWLKKIRPVKTAIDRIVAAHRDAVTKMEKGRRAELEARRVDTQERIAAAEKRLVDAQTRLYELENRLDAMRAERLMSEFVAERSASPEYTRHLGVIARSRRDFEKLSDLLKRVLADSASEDFASGANEDRKKLPRLDRIILYIDDLDRCPEDKVVDVLQAVHLLLAFPLFVVVVVVVVGVDSRWLVHSLRQHASAFRAFDAEEHDSSDERWRSTPQNYLEKIFQIPFWVRPMAPDGFASMIDALAPVADGSPGDVQAAKSAPSGGPAYRSIAASDLIVNASLSPPFALRPRSLTDDRIDLNPANLEITKVEQEFLKALHVFIRTPRAAKRIVNIYRLLRASVPESEWSRFLNGDGAASDGDFRAALLLLAMLTGYPEETAVILRALGAGDPGGGWWQFFFAQTHDGIQTSSGVANARWKPFENDAMTLRSSGLVGDSFPCSAFFDWAPRVARFSFDAGGVSPASASAKGASA